MVERLFIGDSHVMCFREAFDDKVVQYFSAASARGLVNLRSRSGAGRKCRKLVRSMKPARLFVMFGKVDLEWVYPYKKVLDPSYELDGHIGETVDRYMAFLEGLAADLVPARAIHVMGVHLPVLRSGEMLQCLNREKSIKRVSRGAQMSRERIGAFDTLDSLEERTRHTLHFNTLLRGRVEAAGFTFMDIVDLALDEHTGIRRDALVRCDDPPDHHYDRQAACKAWCEKYPALLGD